MEKVVCIAVAEPEAVADWAKKVGLGDSDIETWADTKGAWTRMLGLDIGPPEETSGPKSQRWALWQRWGLLMLGLGGPAGAQQLGWWPSHPQAPGHRQWQSAHLVQPQDCCIAVFVGVHAGCQPHPQESGFNITEVGFPGFWVRFPVGGVPTL